MARNLLYTFIVLKAFPAPKTLFPINIARNLDTSVYPQSTILYSYPIFFNNNIADNIINLLDTIFTNSFSVNILYSKK